ncbi:MAG: NAD-dependent epimerase [Pelodictyon luteolum]|uniref:NAD-dependent epimerase n=1 Tax=Pelodictyon luteolum TaxID=1100 RepID=A0A165LWN1_PELLU|nr:SDR family oxidoreductase [Pelodictyon luteolum]KZK74523.1 MAG: NAD-dependent epimerase [Pelodictyon luteolum]
MQPYSGTVFVAGATGRTGREILKRLQHYGVSFRLYVRSADKLKELFGNAIEDFVRIGSLEDEEALKSALEECDAIISAIGSNPADPTAPPPSAIDRDGVMRLAAIAESRGLKKFVLLSSLGATKPDHPLNKYGQVLKMKLEGENEVRRLFGSENRSYTIIRPGGLLNTPPFMHRLLAATGDSISGSVSRGDVAEVAVLSLWNDGARNRTFELIEESEEQQESLVSVFDMLEE